MASVISWMSTLLSLDGAGSLEMKRFCQLIGRRQRRSLAFALFLVRRLRMSQVVFLYQNRKVVFQVTQRVYTDYLLTQGLDGAKELYDQRVFDRAGGFASVALQSNSLFARVLAKIHFNKVETDVFHALIGRPAQLTIAEAVKIAYYYHSQEMLLMLAFAQLLGHIVLPGVPSADDIMHRVPLQSNNPNSCFVHGLFLLRSGDLNGGIQLLDHIENLVPGKFPEAVMETVRESLRRSFAGLGYSECVSRLKRLIAIDFEPATKIYLDHFLGRAIGVKAITSELMELDKLSPSTRSQCVKKSLNKRLWATTARKRGEAHRLRIIAQKARAEAIRLQQLCQSSPSDKTRKRAQKAEELASELERKADAASEEVEQNKRLVLEANESIKEARTAATQRAKEDAKAAKALRDEAKQIEKRNREEAKATKPAKRAKE